MRALSLVAPLFVCGLLNGWEGWPMLRACDDATRHLLGMICG